MGIKLMYIDDDGRVCMVDVGGKDDIDWCVIVEVEVYMEFGILKFIEEGNFKKGDVFGVVRFVGIMGVK